MKQLTSAQIRQMWLDFWKSKGHAVEPVSYTHLIVKGFMQPLRNVGLTFTLTKANVQGPIQVGLMIPMPSCF